MPSTILERPVQTREGETSSADYDQSSEPYFVINPDYVALNAALLPHRDQVSVRIDSEEVTRPVTTRHLIAWQDSEIREIFERVGADRLSNPTAMSTDQIVGSINKRLENDISVSEINGIFHAWVELVLAQLYANAKRSETLPKWCDTFFWALLSSDLLMQDLRHEEIRAVADIKRNVASQVLKALKDLALEYKDGLAIEPLGWLFCSKSRPPLLILWDQYLPYARMQHLWQAGKSVQVVSVNGDEIVCKIFGKISRGKTVRYKASQWELEGVEPGDWMRYWDKFRGKRVLLPLDAMSPFPNLDSQIPFEERGFEPAPYTVG